LGEAPGITIPTEALEKIFDGLLKNAVENTPDEGRVEVVVKSRAEGALLQVRDYGVGITPENQVRIFDGFFTTRETMDYSSKRPFDFNAGGKGTDLLRIKIFAERYGFEIELTSTRCALLPADGDICPGRISSCPRCSAGGGCHESVATIFSLYFPPAATAR
jgi:signal transduction histidine kinase